MSEALRYGLILMGTGMAGIFAAMIIIMLIVRLLTLAAEIKKNKADK